MTQKITINLDATGLGSSACMTDLLRTTVGELSDPLTGGYREKALNIAIVYGIAFHKYMDVMFKTKGHIPTARAEAFKLFAMPSYPDKKKPWMSDSKHLLSVCFNVWEEWVVKESSFQILDFNGQPSTEQNFSIPYYEDEWIKINLCGTIDTIGKFHNGCYAIRDWKTTGSWDNEGYFEQYELSRQLRIYRLACRIMSERFPDSILGKIGATRMGAFIDGVFLSANPNEVSVKRSQVFQYEPVDIDAFQLLLDNKIQDISKAVRTGYIPKEGMLNGACEASPDGIRKFAKCKFWHVCKSNATISSLLLKRDFIQKPYDPLNFNT